MSKSIHPVSVQVKHGIVGPRMMNVEFMVCNPHELAQVLTEGCDPNGPRYVPMPRDISETLARLMGCETAEEEVTINRVILSGNWVILFWTDGKVTRLKPQPGDEYDPLAGVLAMAYRRVGHNRVKYSRYEDVTKALTGGDYTAQDLRVMARSLEVAADAMESDGYDGDYRPEKA